MIAIDTETHLLKPEGKVRSHHDVPDLVCVTYTDETDAKGLIEWDMPGAGRKLKELVGDQTVVFHNAKFDLAVLSKWRPDLEPWLKQLVDEGRVLDTMVLYANRYPLKDKPRSLANLVWHLFRKRINKGSVRTSFRRGQRITEAQMDYAIDDTIWTLMCAKRLLEIPLGGLARPDHDFEEFIVAAQPEYNGLPPDVLYSSASAYLAWYLEPVGLLVNHEEVARLYQEEDQAERTLSVILYEAGLARPQRLPGTPTKVTGMSTQDTRWTVASVDPLVLLRRAGSRAKGYHVETIPGKWVLNTAELQARFLESAERLRLTPPQTPGGGISLEYDYWKEYAPDLPEELQRYLDLTKVRKYKSAFVGPLFNQRPAFVYPHYLIPGAETGRWACFRPNIQQQPKRLRKMYGIEMVGADYKSLECYTLAHAMASLGIRGSMLDALAETDLHSFVAERCGVTRQQAKVATFGLGGGMGFARFYKYMRYQCGLNVTYDEACQVRMKWLQYFRDVDTYLDLFRVDYYKMCPPWCSKQTWLQDLGFDLDEGWPSSFELSRRLGGRITCVLPSGRVIPRRNFSQAANIFFQGTGADVMTQAFVDLCRNRIQTLAVVHDSAYTPELDAGSKLTAHMLGALVKVCPTVHSLAPQPEWEVRQTFF